MTALVHDRNLKVIFISITVLYFEFQNTICSCSTFLFVHNVQSKNTYLVKDKYYSDQKRIYCWYVEWKKFLKYIYILCIFIFFNEM